MTGTDKTGGTGGAASAGGDPEDRAFRATERMPTTDATPRPATGESPGNAAPERPPSQRYRVAGKLGEGGMAVVYEGYDTNLDRSVALKVLRPEMGRDADTSERFFYEAKLLGGMDHPGMIPVFELGELPEHGSFYAMKKIRGKTLREILDARSKADITDPQRVAHLIGIFHKVCQSVAYAHARGAVHRDLKPANIMVDDYGVVLVLDWGLSKRLEPGVNTQQLHATEAGIIKGTPSYMSPEQAEGKSEEIDYRTDVFALGITLYEILTGKLPFAGENRFQLLSQIMDHNPPSPRRAKRRADRVLSAICMKALNKDREQRYPTAKEFAEDIGWYREKAPTAAYKRRFRDHVASWAARRPALATALAFVATFIVVFGGGGFVGLQVQRTLDRWAQQATITFMSGMAYKVDTFDKHILELEEERNALEPDDASAEALTAEIRELRAARSAHVRYAQSKVKQVVDWMGSSPHGKRDGLDPALLAAIQKFALEEIKSLIQIGDYYEAHFMLWSHLTNPQRIGWSKEGIDEMLKLKAKVEGKMREGKGEDFALPDWEKYRPDAVLQQLVPEDLPGPLGESTELQGQPVP
jgi:Protein kinase domain